jgi:hypothetical protein
MRVLLLHNRYQLAGGEDGVVQAEKSLLEANGHQVCLLEVTNQDITNAWDKVAAAVSAIYSYSAKERVSKEIADLRPDIVHVHNFLLLYMTLVESMGYLLFKHFTTTDLFVPKQCHFEMVRFVRIASIS